MKTCRFRGLQSLFKFPVPSGQVASDGANQIYPSREPLCDLQVLPAQGQHLLNSRWVSVN